MAYTIKNKNESKTVTFGASGGTQPTIVSLQARRTSQADVISWFGNPVERNIFVDADGVQQTYSLEGVFANSIANINSFITDVSTLISGAQMLNPCIFYSASTDVPYIPDPRPTLPSNCVLTSFEYEWTDESMNSIKWAIELAIAKAP